MDFLTALPVYQICGSYADGLQLDVRDDLASDSFKLPISSSISTGLKKYACNGGSSNPSVVLYFGYPVKTKLKQVGCPRRISANTNRPSPSPSMFISVSNTSNGDL